MAYRVIVNFADALDKGHIYRAGDNYPRIGKASELRIAELLGYGNKIGRPLIEVYMPEEKQQDAPIEDAPIEDAPADKPKRGRPKSVK